MDYLLIDENTNKIMGKSSKGASASGYRSVKVVGNAYQTGGTLTEDGTYTAPEAEPKSPCELACECMKNLDASAETGALKTIIEYLQRNM